VAFGDAADFLDRAWKSHSIREWLSDTVRAAAILGPERRGM
jgi:hypothetical protein